MVRHDKVAHRYAKAIFEHAGSGAKARALGLELAKFAQAVGTSPELGRVLNSNLFPAAQRRPVVEDIAKKLSVSGEGLRVLLVLSEAKRLGSLAPIVDRLHELVLQSEDVVPLSVESAHALNNDEREKVEKRFSGMLGKKVEATYVLDASVLGGLRVTAAGRSYNGTLAGWLGAFQERLVGG
jgi:F-type H+-transporting ATPase subunit delta